MSNDHDSGGRESDGTLPISPTQPGRSEPRAEVNGSAAANPAAISDYLSAVRCGNPGCGYLVKRTKLFHALRMTFEVWQCPKCGWIREVQTPTPEG